MSDGSVGTSDDHHALVFVVIGRGERGREDDDDDECRQTREMDGSRVSNRLTTLSRC